jgi:hypothetical protein
MHKRTHALSAVDEGTGKVRGARQIDADEPGHLGVDGGDDDRAGAMAQSVVDEIPESLLEPEAVRRHSALVGRSNQQWTRLIGCASREALSDSVKQRGEVDRRTSHRQLALVGAGRHRQIVGELHDSVGLGRGRADRVLELLAAVRAAQRKLKLGDCLCAVVERDPDDDHQPASLGVNGCGEQPRGC